MTDRPKPVAEHPVFSRIIAAGHGDETAQGTLDVAEADRAAIAAFLGIAGLQAMRFDYHLEPQKNRRFPSLLGRLSATLTQLCVVTLDPVEERVEEEVSLECWPEDQIETPHAPDAEVEIASLDEDAPVPIADGGIDLGALSAEILASAMNPYPRKQDAAFDWTPPQAEGSEASHPFAKLAKLKSKP
ncbi:MAG: DUF177 domain-containing protein [Rhodomicrobium sp.]|nr:DUF177 domain-containing protein [Rhodomicrobium sp.]